MPVVSCPKCPTKLRVPDGASGNTKCPKCSTVFPVNAPAPPAFEVVDDAPTSPPARPTPAKPAPSKPAAKEEFDFDDDVPKKKNKRDEEDEDETRPRKRRRDDDEDDDDDRPRGRRRRDDDEDDDRPRKRKTSRRRRDYDDDDEDDDNWRPASKSSGFGNAKTGVLLLNISFWLYTSVLALITFLLFLAWVGAFDGSSSPRGGFDDDFGGGRGGGETLVMLVGITGLANWVLAIIGLGFCIAGPARARGMAITATALAGAHLVLTGLTVNNLGGGVIGRFSGGLGGGTWLCWTSMLPFLDVLLPALIYSKGSFPSELLIAFLAGACELARFIFTLLTVKQLAVAAKDYETAGRLQIGVVAGAVIAGASAALVLLVAIMLDAGITKSFKAIGNIVMITLLLVYAGFTLMTLLPALSTGEARAALARKAR